MYMYMYRVYMKNVIGCIASVRASEPFQGGHLFGPFPSTFHYRSSQVAVVPASFQCRRQLQKKADEVELGQLTPSFSRKVKPACRGPQEHVSAPPDGCSVL